MQGLVKQLEASKALYVHFLEHYLNLFILGVTRTCDLSQMALEEI